ncbi:MAG: PadR family transcriptional regulator [Nitrososphaerales archaeon]
MRLEDPEYWKALVNMGLSRLFILQALHQQPTHGYALLENLSVFTKGCCTPAYGTIYPILKELLEGDYAEVKVENEGGRQRKVYELTAKGELAYQQALRTWQEVLPYIEKAVHESEGAPHA